MMDAFKGKLTQGFSGAVKDLGTALADFFFPRVCLVCGEDAQCLPLCKECLAKLKPVDEVYTREDRKVTSLPSLETQVRRCDAALELRWFDEEVSGVTNLLNDRFYHFKP